jgi:hypothetical protein
LKINNKKLDLKLPKMYAPVYIKFWSLRIKGSLDGVVFDCDHQAVRKCRRVIFDGSWRFQIIDCAKNRDCCMSADTETLRAYGDELEFEVITKEEVSRYA